MKQSEDKLVTIRFKPELYERLEKVMIKESFEKQERYNLSEYIRILVEYKISGSLLEGNI